MKNRTKRADVYQLITDRIIAYLESDQIPWEKPWHGGAAGRPKNLLSKKPYNGVNVFMLSMAASVKGYDSPYWLTFKQTKDMGGNVIKGEKSTPIVFWKLLNVKDKDSGEKKEIPFLRYSNVFNLDQVEGIDVAKIPASEIQKPDDLEFEPVAACDNMIEQWLDRPVVVHENKGRAFYSPAKDFVNMPPAEKFKSSEEYYAILFHEYVHSTGNHKRLKRFDPEARVAAFGSTDYSKEELIAEMGAAFLCGITGIEKPVIKNSAAYIQSWLSVLKGDKKMVIQAAGKAQAAANYISGQ